MPGAAPTRMTVVVEGFDMPGRSCAPAGAPGDYQNVHVGVQRGREVVDLVPGDAPAAIWTLPVVVKHPAGGSDFTGPFVHGRPGDRFVYLSWGEVEEDRFQMFRRAKLHFADAPPEVLATAARDGALRCRVRMTDASGNPRCARVRPPDAVWTAS